MALRSERKEIHFITSIAVEPRECNLFSLLKTKGICENCGPRDTTPSGVGQHIVCIDRGVAPANTNSWSGVAPEPPRPPPTPKGEQNQRKDERMRKEKMFAMRMSQQDYDRIQYKAGQAGLSMTGFLTTSALDKNIVVVNGLDKVTTELKAIGRNLN